MDIKEFVDYSGSILYTAKDNLLYEIKVTNANLSINNETGFIKWTSGIFNSGLFFNGTWQSGTWESGTWYNGTFFDGIWEDGEWYNGRFGAYIEEKNIPIWYNGIWHNGFWYDGKWHNGIWHNGTWKDGTWNNGIWNDGKIINKKNGKTFISKVSPK